MLKKIILFFQNLRNLQLLKSELKWLLLLHREELKKEPLLFMTQFLKLKFSKSQNQLLLLLESGLVCLYHSFRQARVFLSFSMMNLQVSLFTNLTSILTRETRLFLAILILLLHLIYLRILQLQLLLLPLLREQDLSRLRQPFQIILMAQQTTLEPLLLRPSQEIL